MEAAIRRSLSPWPTLLVGSALLLLFVAERLVGGDGARWGIDAVAGVLFVAAVAMRVLALRGVDGAARRVALAALASYGVIALAAGCYALQLSLVDEGAPDARGPVLLYAASMLLFVVGIGPLLALELVTANMRPAAFVEWRRARGAIGTGLALATGLGALFAINFTAHARSFRHDFSFGAPTSPSPATVSLVQASPEPIHVYLFFGRGSRVLAEVRDYFDRLAEVGATIHVLDQAVDPELAKEIKVTGNGYVGLKGGERTGRWYLGTNYDSARGRLKRMDKELRGEIAKLAIDKRTVYFTSGHGERGDTSAQKGEAPAGKKLRDLVRSLNGVVRSLGLAEGLGRAVPEDADLVVIFGPTSPFLEGEVGALKAYVERGGSVLALLEPRVDHGLQPVLELLGVTMGSHEVCNDEVFLQQTYTKADRAFLVTNAFTNHPAVRSLNKARGRAALALLGAGRLAKAATKPKGKSAFVVRTLPKSFEDQDGDREFDATGESRGVLDLAAVIERSGDTAARAVVLADSDALADLLLGNQTNLVFAYDLVSWLFGDEVVSGEVASDEDVPIRHTREGDTLWFYGTTFAAPTLVLGAGLGFVAVKRRRRRAS